jgi:aminomethyltransferase
MTEPTKTAFHGKLEAMGAGFNEDGGWLWMTDLGDPMKEYNAVRKDVGVWDLSPLVKWDFSGPDAVKAANWVNTNDISGMKVGQVRYGPFLNAAGGVVDDGTVYKLADDHLFVMTNGEGHADYWAENLKQFDVQVKNVAREMPHLAIQGPRAREVVQSLTDTDISGLRYFNFIPEKITLGGATGYLARTGFSGELGYEFFTSPDQADKAWDGIVGANNLTPFGVTAIYMLRLEAGLLIQGDDYDADETNPFDCGLDRFVHMGKDFLGKAAIAGIAANPPNAYKTLQMASQPEDGAVVKADGKDVGVVRCSIQSPEFGWIAGARIARSVALDGNQVEVDGAEAIVQPWSIYDPEKKKPRS